MANKDKLFVAGLVTASGVLGYKLNKKNNEYTDKANELKRVTRDNIVSTINALDELNEEIDRQLNKLNKLIACIYDGSIAEYKVQMNRLKDFKYDDTIFKGANISLDVKTQKPNISNYKLKKEELYLKEIEKLNELVSNEAFLEKCVSLSDIMHSGKIKKDYESANENYEYIQSLCRDIDNKTEMVKKLIEDCGSLHDNLFQAEYDFIEALNRMKFMLESQGTKWNKLSVDDKKIVANVIILENEIENEILNFRQNHKNILSTM